MPRGLAEIAGFHKVSGWAGMCSGDNYNRLIDRALHSTARRLQSRVVKRWEANGRSGALLRYIWLVLEGEGSPTRLA